MLQVTQHMLLLVCFEPIDFRNGIDGLMRVCRETLAEDPFRGAVFVFRKRRSTSIIVLTRDWHGYWLRPKSLSTSRFGWWPDDASARSLFAHELPALAIGRRSAVRERAGCVMSDRYDILATDWRRAAFKGPAGFAGNRSPLPECEPARSTGIRARASREPASRPRTNARHAFHGESNDAILPRL